MFRNYSVREEMTMKIYVTSVFVDIQAHALDFYTNKLGFEVKNDIPVGEHRNSCVSQANIQS